MLKLYYASGSPYAWRAQLALEHLRRCQTRMAEVGFDELIGLQFGAWMARMDSLAFADACIPPHWKAAA
ncbi:MAG: glutathione S-transferase N-terminal domain-containing protein [Casimicrobiaceae bacterium]